MLRKVVVFTKAQVSAFIGGVVDYLLMITITETLHIHYTISIAISGIIGAIVNFSINRAWSFHSKVRPYKSSFFIQLLKFIPVVLNSILLKSAGTYLITNFWGVDYKISRLIADLFVSILFNYTLQRFWVFKNVKINLQSDQHHEKYEKKLSN
jgi:putative flippase GtrA